MNWQETRQFLSPCFPESVQAEMEMLMPGELREIRIRAERPTVFVTATRAAALDWTPQQKQLAALVEALTEHSLYARADETSQGYITLRGGHRMGLCGRVVAAGQERTLPDVGSVCIRIAAEWAGTADPIMPLMMQGGTICSLLVIGPPGAGKTTLLRDLARQLGSGRHAAQTALIDERGELAACVRGIPQLDVGECTDVLDGLVKAQAFPWLLRAMAPQCIITDELFGPEDAACVMEAAACGTAVCASVHGSSLQDAASRPSLASLMAKRVFHLYAVLDSAGGGQVAALYDRTGSPLPLP